MKYFNYENDKKILILLIGFLFFSCTDEPDLNNYNLAITNNTNQIINIKSYLEEDLVSSINLSINQRGLECSYKDESFRGYRLTSLCGIDSIIFNFGNNKGYISTINNTLSLDFQNDSNPFGASDKFILNENTYEFVITQEDIENANDLP